MVDVLLGPLWIDHEGDVEIVSHTNGLKSKVSFKQSGWIIKKFDVKATVSLGDCM
jgi:hypothetical protein